MNFFKAISKYWLLIVMILQPMLDIIAYFNFNTYITPISFVFRTLILFFIVFYTFIKSKNKKKFILCILPFAIFSILHLLNSYRVGYISLFDDIRYLIIVMQMPILTICFINYIKENNQYLSQVKIGFIINVLIVFVSLILALISGNFNYTYEGYGLTGWFTSANTQSMILVAICPIFLYFCSKTTKIIWYLLSHIIVLFLLYENGTKACYITLVISLLIILYITFINEKSRMRLEKTLITILCLLFVAFYSNNSSTFKRMEVMDEHNKQISDFISEKYGSLENIDFKSLSDEEILEILNVNYYWKELIDLYGKDKVLEKMKSHLSASELTDNRLRKRMYASIIYDDTDLLTKFVGFEFTKIGKLEMDLENDFTALYYYYGYIGFGLYVIFILYFVILLMKMFIKDKKMVFNGEFIIYCITLALLIFGSEYSGAFLRKSNANIYMSLLLTLIYFKSLKQDKFKINNKKITFLLLHLGYGGIETSTINTANELSKTYDVELISFYNLKNNQQDRLSKDINIKYLYQKEPNKNELLQAIKDRKLISIFKNLFPAIKILFLKRYLIIKEIIESDSFATVSTRNEFSVLLSQFGNPKTIKIAQIHQHHNYNKKYINNIKYKFNNIDYIFALTNSLKNDYEKFLINNKKTKVLVVPNFIDLPNKISSLKNKNIITVSRLHSIKKLDDLILIFSKVKDKDSKLYIIGDGEELDNLKRQVTDKKLTNRVIFTGYKNSEEIEEYFLNSRIFAMTSISEGLPMTLLEAMSYGLPCIAFRTDSGIPDIIDNEINGYIIENRDISCYSKKLDELLDNEKLVQKLSKNSLKKSKEYSSKEIIKIWKGVLSGEK